jgi:sugar lactone lactonase YvrE
LAGSGSSGSADRTGTAASFNYPEGVAVDSSGNLYVADSDNYKIRKITPAGVVTTLAGSGVYGSADGTGTAASFAYTQGVAVDSSGNAYVADSGNNKIRKITPAGVVTTLAGGGGSEWNGSGSADGTGSAASFAYPNGVAVDSSGNVYVADSNNNKIRKITPAGGVTTLAGSGFSDSEDGTGTVASFAYPRGVAVDKNGNIYVADSNNNKIRKITSGGLVTTLAGSSRKGSRDGTTASFNYPTGVAVDGNGNMYVADSGNSKIRKITPAGLVTTLAGSGVSGSEDGTGTATSFSSNRGVAVDSTGNVYVADSNNNMIRKITISQ